MTKQILLSGRPCIPFCDFFSCTNFVIFPPSNYLVCVSYYLLLTFIVNSTPNSSSNISNFCQDTQHLRRFPFPPQGKASHTPTMASLFRPKHPLLPLSELQLRLPEFHSLLSCLHGANTPGASREMVWCGRELLVPCMSENIFGPPKQLADSSVFREF